MATAGAKAISTPVRNASAFAPKGAALVSRCIFFIAFLLLIKRRILDAERRRRAAKQPTCSG